MVRRILSSVLQQQTMDDDGLHTVMCEAETNLTIGLSLNCPHDLEPFTPNHILLVKGKPSLLPGLFDPHALYIKKKMETGSVHC